MRESSVGTHAIKRVAQARTHRVTIFGGRLHIRMLGIRGSKFLAGLRKSLPSTPDLTSRTSVASVALPYRKWTFPFSIPLYRSVKVLNQVRLRAKDLSMWQPRSLAVV